MLSIEKVDTQDKSQAKRFVQFYYDLYKDCPQFVPPLYTDAYLPLNRKKHPFFGHSGTFRRPHGLCPGGNHRAGRHGQGLYPGGNRGSGAR